MSRWRHALAVVGFFALVAGNIRAPAAAQPPVAITITAQPITEARKGAMKAGQYSAAVAATKEIGVLTGIRIERSERGQPGEFDWLDKLSLEELRALAKGERPRRQERREARLSHRPEFGTKLPDGLQKSLRLGSFCQNFRKDCKSNVLQSGIANFVS